MELHRCASKHDDAQLTDFLEGNYLKEQVEAQKEIGDLITKVCHFIASTRKLAGCFVATQPIVDRRKQKG